MHASPPLSHRLFLAFLLAVLLFSSYQVVRLAAADVYAELRSEEHLRRAIAIYPDDAKYWERLATALDERPEQEDEIKSALRKALEFNPRDTTARIDLALREERTGNYEAAEAHLIAAARWDKQYQPAWTLMNFYLRRGRPGQVLQWSPHALRMSYLEPPWALFGLIWTAAGDADTTLAQIPQTGIWLRKYLWYLSSTGKMDAASIVAARLLPIAEPVDQSTLLSFLDRQIATGSVPEAIETWNAMAARGLLEHRRLQRGVGEAVTNIDFAHTVLKSGFDWRFANTEGVRVNPFPAERQLRITLTGKQPEFANLLWQYLPVAPAAEYKLRLRYRTPGNSKSTGIHVSFSPVPAAPGAAFEVEPHDLSSEDWKDISLSVRTPKEIEAALLVFRFDRPPGSVRYDGRLELKLVSLQPVGTRSQQ